MLPTHEDAPRVLISTAMVVPAWSDEDSFRRLEDAGLTMYGQMTAAGWFYIGTQGILGFTYETFRAVAETHFGGTLAGRRVLTAGLGGMGGAQGFGVTRNGGRALVVEVDPARAERRLRDGWVDVVADYDDALAAHLDPDGPGAVALLGNAADVVPRLLDDGVEFDVVTDQTPAHDPLRAYVPRGFTAAEAAAADAGDEGFRAAVFGSLADHVRALLAYRERGVVVFEYGNGIRAQAAAHGVDDAFEIPGFVSAYVRPIFAHGVGPFRWICLSGDPADLRRSEDVVMEVVGTDSLRSWIELARERVPLQGLPARICWLGLGQRDRVALALNELVRSGRVRAARARPRPHGSSLGRLADTRDRGDARRQRRDRRLARALGAPQRRPGRELGRDRKRGRRRRGALDPLGDGRRRGRLGARRAEAAARVLVGPGPGRGAVRGRRLSGGARRGRAPRPGPSGLSFRLERDLRPGELAEALRREARDGLTATPKHMRSRWIWDARGAELYERIMELPEYYLPEAERSILRERAGEIAEMAGPRTVVELGSGSSVKTTILLDALPRLERFVAVDVDESSLVEAGERLAERYPRLEVVGVLGDFERDLPGPFERTLLVCLGSTIGALDPGDRASLLASAADALGANGRLLLGLDLVKPVERIIAAYDDSQGLSAQLIANLLPILNRELRRRLRRRRLPLGDRLERRARAHGDGRAVTGCAAGRAAGDRPHG